MISELRMRWKREHRDKRGWHHTQPPVCPRCAPSGAERSRSIRRPPQRGTQFTRKDTKPTCRAKAGAALQSSHLEAKPQIAWAPVGNPGNQSNRCSQLSHGKCQMTWQIQQREVRPGGRRGLRRPGDAQCETASSEELPPKANNCFLKGWEANACNRPRFRGRILQQRKEPWLWSWRALSFATCHGPVHRLSNGHSNASLPL